MLYTQTDFQNVGRGWSTACGWVSFNGSQIWVSMIATSNGTRGQRRDWVVDASYKPKGGEVVRVEASLPNSFRYQAADAALAELLGFLSQKAAA